MQLKFIATLLLGLFMLPLGAAADNSAELREAQKNYLQTAEKYRATSTELAGAASDFNARQKNYAAQLSDIYGQMADTKTALAGAIAKRDWKKEEQLEAAYYRLKDRENELWAALDATKE